ncbi:MAG: hypothetical protein NT166_08125 [Candidatus Aminicenantes bacterium]|nr:hypothetical protein [Candidatus Aminicenantes bacterium]
MKTIINIPIDKIKPDVAGVLKTQGVPPPPGPPPPGRVTSLYHSAEELFLKLAAPTAIMAEVTIPQFTEIFKGNGLNEPDTPLEKIFPRASQLALFAFTLGPEVCLEIEEQLNTHNFALGYMLDAVSSYSTDKGAGAAQNIFLEHLTSTGQADASTRALLYSPGYCGWHISGQQKLFEYLKPEEIGIHLNKSFLMTPLKSISGVLVAGDKRIHRFKNSYTFCVHCPSKNCRERIAQNP